MSKYFLCFIIFDQKNPPTVNYPSVRLVSVDFLIKEVEFHRVLELPNCYCVKVLKEFFTKSGFKVKDVDPFHAPI